MSDNPNDSAQQFYSAEVPCPACGTNMPDWVQFCPKCGNEMRSQEAAVRAELSHISYLQTRVSSWQNSGFFSSLSANRVQAETEARRKYLLSSIRPVAPTTPPMPAQPPRPIVPPLPANISSGVPLWGAADPALSSMAPVSPTASASNRGPSPRTVPSASAVKAPAADIKDFMQAHGLKLVFALATLLVVFSLRSIIAWHEVGAIAIRLVPGVLLGLTAMFWTFGQRTREENPWAGFVYHGMASLMVAFDIAAMNRYWLGAAGASLPLKPALLICCAAGTLTSGVLLFRNRQITYLHLFQTGALATLYAVLQFLRLMLWHQNDFRSTPIILFGAAYLLLAALNFALASRTRSNTLDLSSRVGKQGNTDPQSGSASSEGESVKAGAADNAWATALALWAHLSVAAVLIISSVNVLLQEQIHLHDFAALALLAGVLYAVGAQMLEEKRMVYLSGFMTGASLLFWLADSYALLWNRFGFLLLALSAAAMALAAYNEKRAARNAAGRGLATAWRGVAKYGTFIAMALTGFQILARWPSATWSVVPLSQTVTGLAEAALTGLLLLLLARWENRSDCVYGALVAGGMALVSALEAVRAPIGGYALAFMLYGWTLFGMSLIIEARQRVFHRTQGAVSPTTPLPGARASSKPAAWLDETVCKHGAHVAAGFGLIIAALLPVHNLLGVWAWTTATLVLGCLLYAVTAEKEKSAPAIYASLLCMAYASGLIVWRISLHRVSPADVVAPFAVGTAFLALLLSRTRQAEPIHAVGGAMSPAVGNLQRFASRWEPWREPLSVLSTVAVIISVLNGLIAFLIGYGMEHPVLSLLPACTASLLLAASSRESRKDTLCSLALILLNCAAALEIAFLSGLNEGHAKWQMTHVQNACIGWLLQGWAFWLFGRFVSRKPAGGDWTSDLAANGMAAGLLSALAMTVACAGLPLHSGLLPLWLVMAGAFGLMFLQTWITEGIASRASSLVVVVLAAAAFTVHTSTGIPTQGPFRFLMNSLLPGAATAMTVFFVISVCAYFALAFKQQEPEYSFMALVPLALGYSLFFAWKASAALSLFDRRASEILWLVVGIGTGMAYLKTVRLRSESSFATLSALVLTATYCHAASLAGHPQPQWYALILLPCLLALYTYGAYSEAAEEYIGGPFRSVALAASGIVLLWSCLYGDVLLAAASGLPAHTLITWTLFAYGAAYAGLAFYRRSPITVGVGASVLTVAYCHGLLTETSFWQAQGNSFLSGPKFACLAIMAGYAWLGLAWFLDRRLARRDLANPLFAVTGVLAGFSALIAILTNETPGQGDWSLITLGCAGILWLGLWSLDVGEMCWHVCAWNLLAAWIVFIQLHLEWTSSRADLYLLPFGIYCLVIGHRWSVLGRNENARLVWWFGLLTVLTPAFLLYWTNAPGKHEVLLILECGLITLFGVIRRIRAYVGAGLAFSALLTAASIIGHIPNYAGTLLALAMGVALFVAGFYALTHRETIQAWLSRLSTQWQAWQAWR